jgi:site-specific DNA-methyltransferase (adenine-specific)
MNIDTKVYRKHESPTFGNTVLGAVPLVSEVYLMDNIELMKHYPDKYFDLAVVDPPYGININHSMGRRKGDKPSNYKKADWDNEPPPLEYFYELFRVSKNQIVWGANHFISRMPYDSACWLMWDKKFSDEVSFAQYEMAWTSLDGTCKKFDKHPTQENRIHPTQKPITLYDWIFSKYTTEGMKILDTHLGSGSSRISANKAKLHFVGCELDQDHFNKQNKRYEEFVSQARLW